MRNGRRGLARRLVRRLARRDPAELNITAFMNLMVILVPFLLIGAIFSQLAIVELDLPLSQSKEAQPDEVTKPGLMLVIRTSTITLTEKTAGDLAHFEWTDEQGFDWVGFHEALNETRLALPGAHDITLLSEPEIEYQVLVTFMDRLTGPSSRNGGQRYFGAISLGTAPALDPPAGERG